VKSKQVGYVLMALIVIGVLGLVFRIVSPGSDALALQGLLPITPDVVNEVQLSTEQASTTLVKRSDVWLVQNDIAFQPKLDQFWTAVSDINGAQIVSINPTNHRRMGVADGQGTTVSFLLEGAEQASFIVGTWTQEAALCYVRPTNRNEVYGVPCPVPNVFETRPDGWRNPIVVSIPPEAITAINFEYPDEAFTLRPEGNRWVVTGLGETEGGTQADLNAVRDVLSALQFMIAAGFAPDEETEGLNFTGPDAISVQIVTNPESNIPTTRVRLLPRDQVSYYARTPVQDTVFILEQTVSGALLKRSSDFAVGP
jgi:hypothetical protein